jgi:LemA protein
MNYFIILTLVVVLIIVVALILLYNRLVRARNQLREAWSGMEVQLKLRHDLVPSIVAVVKGYATHEEDLFTAVTRERNLAAEVSCSADLASSAEQKLGREMFSVLALKESYPTLKADQGFRDLMKELVKVEDQIQYARRYYNGSVRDLNDAIETFPSSLVAGFFGFVLASPFEVESVMERVSPEVKI